MEKSRHRKSRSASGIMEGGKLVQKQIATPKVALHSRSYCDGTTRGDMIMVDLEKSSSKRVTGTPIKKLLAEEMAKEGESKRRPPSIVARLMGLEGMPSPQHVGRQQRRFSDSCQRKNEQIDPRRRRQLFDESKRSSMEHQEFKDVYEDLEASHVANHRHSSRWSETGRFATPDMALIQQKFMDAKRLSTDERFQNSKEFDDTLEALESKKELLLKYLQEPDSLFVKHLQDLQVDTASSTCSHIAVLKPSNSVKYEGSAKSCKSVRGGSCKHGINLQKERVDGLLLQSQHRYSGHNSQKSSPVLSVGKEENILPTRIVVLKPNLGITQTDTSVPYHPDVRKHAQYPRASPGGAGPEEEKNSSKNMGISRPKSNEARDIAKEITRRMRDSFGPSDGRDAYFRGSGVKGYAGDESSCDVYESDSTGESDITTLSCRKSSGRGNLKKSSSLGSSESSVGREAKKRLSERWKMTQYYQDIEMAGKSSTLGEMLSLPDEGRRRDYCDNMVLVEEAINESGGRKGTTEWDFPLGISSRDGWKDVCINDSSGYGSTSPPFCSKKHRTRARREVFSNKQYSISKETVNHRRTRSLDGMLNLRDEFLSKDNRSSSKKKLHSCRLGSDSSKGKLLHTIDMNLEENLSKKLPLTSQAPSADGMSYINASDDAETESVTLSSEYSVEMLRKLPAESGSASPLNQEVSIQSFEDIERDPSSRTSYEVSIFADNSWKKMNDSSVKEEQTKSTNAKSATSLQITEPVVSKPDGEEIDEDGDTDSGGEMVDGILTSGTKFTYEIPSQEELIRRDDVEDDFEREKLDVLNEEVPEPEKPVLLPGWGQWTNIQKKRGPPSWMLEEHDNAKKKREEALKKRKDAYLNHVIISEKRDKKEALPEPSPPSSAAASVVLEHPAPEPEPESSVSSKEADYPSPLSVLEVPFTEDVSSGSECFERVSADLSGLRMQLKLLKMESEAYADEAVSDDEVESFEDNCSLMSQSWQSSYTLDVLTDSGLKASDPDSFITSCYSLDCPLSPWVFDNLEKKYTDETTRPRYERRLLFDRINLGLLEIVRKFVDPCPWVKPIEGINWKWQTYGMKNILDQLLGSQENTVIAEDSAIAVILASIVEEMHWLEVKVDMDLIGKEIEKLLIEDLIEEVVTM